MASTPNTADNHVSFLGHGCTQGELGIRWASPPEYRSLSSWEVQGVAVVVFVYLCVCTTVAPQPCFSIPPVQIFCTCRVTAENWAPCDSPKNLGTSWVVRASCFCCKRFVPMASACGCEPADSCSVQVPCELPSRQHSCPFCQVIASARGQSFLSFNKS